LSVDRQGATDDGGHTMSQLSRGILGAIAVSLTLGAAQFALGRDLSGRQQDPAGSPEAVINRAVKADRAVGVAGSGVQTRTISLRLDSLADTSVLVRIPVVREARDSLPAPSLTKSPAGKVAVACEPVVSVLTEVAKQLQPGRCVT
jgi:hypothetical protein